MNSQTSWVQSGHKPSSYDASVKAAIVLDGNGRVTEWRDISGNGRHLQSLHFHPMQVIQRTWWPGR